MPDIRNYPKKDRDRLIDMIEKHGIESTIKVLQEYASFQTDEVSARTPAWTYWNYIANTLRIPMEHAPDVKG